MQEFSKNNTQRHATALRAGRWSEPFACYAITKCVENHRAILTTSGASNLILSSFDFLRQSGDIRLLAFCVMPDHYHVLMFLLGDKSLSETMRSVGKYTATALNQMLGRRGRFWQEGFYDHRCRDEDDIEDLMSYIELNPVRAELVAQPEHWLYSSAHPSQSSLLDRDWYAKMK